MTDALDFDEAYQRIQQRFIQRLKEWTDVFEMVSTELHQGRLKKVDVIRLQMHKLAGSSYTFGFPDLSLLSAEVEFCLDQLIAGEALDRVKTDLLEKLDKFLVEARSILQKTSSSPLLSKSKNSLLEQGAPCELNVTLDDEAVKTKEYCVLIADDDDLVRKLLKEALGQFSCSLVEAVTGKEALRYLERTKENTALAKPNLILLDVNMPEMNGFEALAAIKSDPQFHDTPVIMLTRKDSDKNIIKGIALGAVDYISKPFDVSQLTQRIIDSLTRNTVRILIADDDDVMCHLLRHRFQRMGYSVLIARDGQEALSLLKNQRPHVGILDVMMPGMDGLTVLKQSKKIADIADIPLIILSAKNQRENILRGLEAGAHDYITKPFDIDEVAARVSGILQRRRSAES